MKEKYVPIDCNYYDVILLAATRKLPVEIIYLTESGKSETISSVVSDVKTINGEEYLYPVGAIPIRLDRLVAVDGHTAPHHLVGEVATCDGHSKPK